MRNAIELKRLCENNQINKLDLNAEEVLRVSLGDMHPQEAIKFINKYGHILKQKAITADEFLKIVDDL